MSQGGPCNIKLARGVCCNIKVVRGVSCNIKGVRGVSYDRESALLLYSDDSTVHKETEADI